MKENDFRERVTYSAPEEMLINDVPTTIVDPHNEAFFYWAMAYRKRCERGLEPTRLIHVDRHADNYERDINVEGGIKGCSPKKLWEIVREFRIAELIEPALKYGIIQEGHIWYNPWPHPDRERIHIRSTKLNERDHPTKRLIDFQDDESPIWLDIDLDAFDCIKFGQSLTYSSGTIKSRIAITRDFLLQMPRPDLITIALSQIPVTYVNPKTVRKTLKMTLQMLQSVTNTKPPKRKKIFNLGY
ncbi:hypothetical protein ACFL0X_00350 [Nanoarchaeota archaeon]